MDSNNAAADVSASIARGAAILGPIVELDGAGAFVTNDDPGHARAEAHRAAALGEPRRHGLDHPLRAAGRDDETSGGRGQGEHVTECSTQRVVGPDTDVQTKARKHAPRRLALEQAGRQPPRAAGQQACDLDHVAKAQAQQRPRRWEGAEQHRQQLAFDAGVKARQFRERPGVARAAERRRPDRVGPGDDRDATVERWMAALVCGAPPLDAKARQIQLDEGRAAGGKRKEPRSNVVTKPRQRQLLGSERPSRPAWVCLEHQDPKSAASHTVRGTQAVRPGANHHHLWIHATRKLSGIAAWGRPIV